MKVESTVYPSKVEKLGGKTLVNFLVEEKSRVVGEDTHTYYEYQQVALQYDAPDSDVDKAIVKESERILNERKAEALATMKVRTQSGKLFYVDENSRVDINDAINLAADSEATHTIWKLAEEINGSKLVEVSVDELKEARKLALEEKARVIGVIA